MLGVVGVLCVEVLRIGDWYNLPLAAKQTYLGLDVSFDINTLIGIELILMAAVEAHRFDEIDSDKMLYPGKFHNFFSLL